MKISGNNALKISNKLLKTRSDNDLSDENSNNSFDGDYAQKELDKHITSEQVELWKCELASCDDEQQYYNTVIKPYLDSIDDVIEFRHKRHRDKREIESLEQEIDEKYNFCDTYFPARIDKLHEIAPDNPLAFILKNLKDKQKIVFYHYAINGYKTKAIAAITKTSERNVTDLYNKALDHIRGQVLPLIMLRYKFQTHKKYEWLYLSTTFKERRFAALFDVDYADYYGELENGEFDFVPIMLDYREQELRIKNNSARNKEQIRIGKALEKERKRLQRLLECGKIDSADNSYIKGVDFDYAKDI